jgi:hypothetical protein
MKIIVMLDPNRSVAFGCVPEGDIPARLYYYEYADRYLTPHFKEKNMNTQTIVNQARGKGQSRTSKARIGRSDMPWKKTLSNNGTL